MNLRDRGSDIAADPTSLRPGVSPYNIADWGHVQPLLLAASGRAMELPEMQGT